MKYLLSILIVTSFISCNPKLVPLRNAYPNPPMTFQTDNKPEQVWSNLIDFISTTGMSIKVIDKTSGLLITEDYSFSNSTTFENYKTKKVKDPNAYLVSNWYRMNSGFITPTEIMANWNIRIKEVDNKTVVAVNITNVRAKNTADPYRKFDVKSTGVFEQLVFDQVK